MLVVTGLWYILRAMFALTGLLVYIEGGVCTDWTVGIENGVCTDWSVGTY